jgi:hypothetical protein
LHLKYNEQGFFCLPQVPGSILDSDQIWSAVFLTRLREYGPHTVTRWQQSGPSPKKKSERHRGDSNSCGCPGIELATSTQSAKYGQTRNQTWYQHSVCKIWSDPESNLVPALSLQNTGGPGIELGTSTQIAEMLKFCFDSSPLVFTMIPTKYGRTRNRTWYQHSVCKIRMGER